MTKLFRPPGRDVRVGSAETFFITMTYGQSLLKENGLYRQVIDPGDDELTAADIAYLGGHDYLVTDAEADALTVAGYGSSLSVPGAVLGGYGDGLFGEGIYGAIEIDPDLDYGDGAFGSGEYGE